MGHCWVTVGEGEGEGEGEGDVMENVVSVCVCVCVSLFHDHISVRVCLCISHTQPCCTSIYTNTAHSFQSPSSLPSWDPSFTRTHTQHTVPSSDPKFTMISSTKDVLRLWVPPSTPFFSHRRFELVPSTLELVDASVTSDSHCCALARSVKQMVRGEPLLGVMVK